jgi:hypothetical protein
MPASGVEAVMYCSEVMIGAACVTPVVLAYSAFAYWIFRARLLRTDGKHEDSAAPNSVVLGNLWVVPGYLLPFGDVRANGTEMDKLNCC